MATPTFPTPKTNLPILYADCQWGTHVAGGPNFDITDVGVVISDNVNVQSQTATVENTDGATTGVVIYDTFYDGSVDVVYKHNGVDPKMGDIMTIDGIFNIGTDGEPTTVKKPFLITGVSISENNKDTK